MEVQSVMIDKNVFKTMARANKWIKDHNFKLTFYSKRKPDITPNFFRYRQKAVNHFNPKSFRIKEIDKGVKLVLGEPLHKKKK